MEQCREQVLYNAACGAQAWADQQGPVSYLKGHCEAFAEVANVTFEDIFDEEDQ